MEIYNPDCFPNMFYGTVERKKQDEIERFERSRKRETRSGSRSRPGQRPRPSSRERENKERSGGNESRSRQNSQKRCFSKGPE